MQGQADPAERAQPHSFEAERAALGVPLIYPARVVELFAGLRTDDFMLPAHREIFDVYAELHRREGAIDVITVADELKARKLLARLEGGEAYLTQLANAAPIPDHLPHYIETVAKKATLRRLIATCAEISSGAYGDFHDVKGLLAEASAKITDLALRRVTSLTPISKDVEATLAELEARQQRGSAIIGVSTSLDRLDREIGGLQPENLYVIAARPGIGKTALAMNIARRHAATEDASVLVFSLEMPRLQLVERLIASAGSIDSAQLRSGRIDYSLWKNNIHPASGKLASLPMYIVDDEHTIAGVEAAAHRWRAKYPDAKGLIVVDYLQLFDVQTGRGVNMSDAVGHVSKRLKRLAKKLKVPIILLSQLNRDSEKEGRRPKLSDLRASGDIEQDADVVIFIHDTCPKNDNGEEVRTVDGPVELIIGKNRHGATGITKVRWLARYYSFTDLGRGDDVADAPPVADGDRGFE